MAVFREWLVSALSWWQRQIAWLRLHARLTMRTIWGVVGLAALLVAFNAVIFLHNAQQLSTREALVQHTQQMQTEMQTLLSTLDEAETGQRGYLLTGDATYLTTYTFARQTVSQDVAQVQRLTTDPTQQQRLRALVPMINDKMTELQQTVQLAQQGQTAAALQIVRSKDGNDLMVQIRQIIGTMNATQTQLLEQRSLAAQDQLHDVIITFITGTLALLGLLSAMGWLMQHQLLQRERVAAERLTLLENESAARQKAEDAVKTRDDFLAVASHELKTPITAISTTTQMLQRAMRRDAAFTDRLREMVDIQANQTKRLLLLIESMLDVSRIENGTLSLHRVPTDLLATLTPIVHEMEMSSSRHTLELSVPAAPVLLVADAARLEQVWYNLLQNAIKYSPAGGEITVRVTTEESQAVVAITDHGIGLPLEAQQHLFELFYRAPNTQVQDLRIKGMGVGLHVTQQIVAQHDGTITVESAPGQGSTFTVRLPLAPSQVEAL